MVNNRIAELNKPGAILLNTVLPLTGFKSV